MARNPGHSWSIIHQQSWALRLKDRLGPTSGNMSSNNYSSSHFRQKDKISEPCKRYNWGFCPYGASCKYEHKCAYSECLKFGHSILNCRKIAANKEKSSHKSDKRRDNGHGSNRHKETSHNGSGGNRQQ